eukprot:scaffold29085_cov112-Isochrysis_galbana.AAC.5
MGFEPTTGTGRRAGLMAGRHVPPVSTILPCLLTTCSLGWRLRPHAVNGARARSADPSTLYVIPPSHNSQSDFNLNLPPRSPLLSSHFPQSPSRRSRAPPPPLLSPAYLHPSAETPFRHP